MKDRLLELRKKLDYTQAEFAERINLKRPTITNYESGATVIPDRVILDICREFNVSEDWLRDGVGPMFRPMSTDNELAAAVGSLIASEDDFTKKIVLKYLKLPDEHKKIFEKFLRELVAEDESTQKK